MARLKSFSLLGSVLRSLLVPYAGVVFSGDPRVGGLLLLAVFTQPRLGGATLLAVALSRVVAQLFGLVSPSRPSHKYGTTAILTTLGLGLFDPGGSHPLVLVGIGAVLSVFVTAALDNLLDRVALPAHALPFVVTTWLVHVSARALPAVLDRPSLLGPIASDWLTAGTWLDAPAALLFQRGPLPGLLVVLAIALHSRISLVLATLGAAAAFAVRWALRADLPLSHGDTIATFNAMLTAMALGGVWFVPQPATLVLAATGGALTALLTHALVPLAAPFGLPVLALPFVVTTWLVLLAARQRERDKNPRATVPMARPEDALASHLTRVRRFGDSAWLPFRLPVRGQWVVTQGYDGRHTHQGPWRHGLDFEVRGTNGLTYRGDGESLDDYHCYGLPVVAAGGGTVVEVVDGVPDNPPGDVNLHQNWGNAVVLCHGGGVYSVYAHLQPGSAGVRPGEVVSAGQKLGRCGSSGRSPVPHLHFQVQEQPALGSATAPCDFGDVVLEGRAGLELRTRSVPQEHEVVRPVVRDEALGRAFALRPGSVFELESGDQRELARVEVDLLGRRCLRSDRAELLIDRYDSGLVAVGFAGDRRSLLRFVLVALARVPFDQARSLRYHESLPRRLLLPPWARAAAELLAVVAPSWGETDVDFRVERNAGSVVVTGRSERWLSRVDAPLDGDERYDIAVEHRGRSEFVTMRRCREAPAASEAPEPMTGQAISTPVEVPT